MVKVTERAIDKLQQVLLKRHAGPGQGVRVTAEDSGGLAMAVGTPQEGDVMIRREEALVLIMARAVAARLKGMIVDFRPATDDPRRSSGFVVRRPRRLA
jgi:Fe-S cluster assembly iron-binding protein IscA